MSKALVVLWRGAVASRTEEADHLVLGADLARDGRLGLAVEHDAVRLELAVHVAAEVGGERVLAEQPLQVADLFSELRP